MTPRTERLRQESLDAVPCLDGERAKLVTDFHREHLGRHSVPRLRALAYRHLCEHKTVWIGEGELIVGERGPRPKAVPTYPELTCHSVEDLRILDTRPKTSYRVPPEMIDLYAREVIPYWRGRSLRDQLWETLSPDWHAAYEAGVFTEFMEQRAPGHTVLDGKIYDRGLRDFMADIDAAENRLDFLGDPEAADKREQLRAMRIACEATIRFAERHAELADRMALAAPPERAAELRRIAEVCRRVPAEAPRDFQELVRKANASKSCAASGYTPGTAHLTRDGTNGLVHGAYFKRPDGSRVAVRENQRPSVQPFYYAAEKPDDASFYPPAVRSNLYGAANPAAGSLPDGRVFIVGNSPQRQNMYITVSRDGRLFDRSWLLLHRRLSDYTPGAMKTQGGPGSGPQYFKPAVAGQSLWLVYSISKEHVGATRVPIGALET